MDPQTKTPEAIGQHKLDLMVVGMWRGEKEEVAGGGFGEVARGGTDMTNTHGIKFSKN